MDETTEAKTHQSCNLPSALINERDIVPAGKRSGERKERVRRKKKKTLWQAGQEAARRLERERKKKEGIV